MSREKEPKRFFVPGSGFAHSEKKEGKTLTERLEERYAGRQRPLADEDERPRYYSRRPYREFDEVDEEELEARQAPKKPESEYWVGVAFKYQLPDGAFAYTPDLKWAIVCWKGGMPIWPVWAEENEVGSIRYCDQLSAPSGRNRT